LTTGDRRAPDTGLPDALRAAVESTLDFAGRSARAGSAALRPDRRAELLDEVTRRGREARDEIARRGQEARDELGRRLEQLEKRLGSIEDLLRDQADESKGKSKV
jgi:hypothetical protein